MSEVTEKPAEIVPAKSEDKLEIEKEEKEEKVEDKVEGDSSEDKEKEKKEEKDESEEKGESSSAEKGEKDGEDTEKKETEKADEKEKKFSMPKIKTPKIIKEIRSRSKSREKKKKKEKDDEENEEAPEKEAAEKESDEENKDKKAEDDDKKEEKSDKEDANVEKGEDKDSEEKEKPDDTKESEAEGKSEENSEKKDVVKEAKSKVKDALDSIHLPKMPKMHKPAFLKKKTKEDGEKAKGDEEGNDDKTEETKDEKVTSEESKEKTEKSEEKEEKDEKECEEKKEDDTEDKDVEKKEKTDDDEQEKKEDSDKSEEGVEEKKPSIIDSFKNIKAPKMPKIFSKTKKGETDLETGKCDESEQLLEEKDQPDGDEKEEGESEPKEKQKGTSILKSIRNVASGVPALFKKDSPKETDVESGEKDDLLEKKEDTTDNKQDDLKMEEIKLDDDEKKDDLDNKSQGSEKKDPEKGEGGEVMEEKSKMDRFKRLPSEAVRQISSLDKQKIYGIVGVLAGLLLLILVIIIAAVTPGGWKNYHKLVEGGKYVETETGCGKVWGWVKGEDRFLFRAIPYSVDVERFSHSKLPTTLDECGDEIKHPSNESRVCMRRTASGVVGEEDCLTLDIATSSVVYDNPAPVVVYIAGDNEKLVPSADLAYKQGVVFVTVSVRQGILGYLSHSLVSESEKPPTSGNYALGDLITALKWIQLNIRHFGGNPDMVTLLGHQQGASLVTALTAVDEGHGLYKRIWATGGAGNTESLSLDDANKQFDDLVKSVCKDSDRDCLLELDAEDLVGKVKDDAESWSHDNLPTRGESTMMSWITTDTKLLRSSLSKILSSSPVSVPIVFGVAAQAEANSANYQLYDWNNTDQVDSIVESNLGSFDVSLAAGALDLYNNSNNWLEYISMVSDIRTVCPLKRFASNFKQNFSNSEVSFYIAQQANPSEDNESGNVADSSTDISAIFGLYEDQRFGENLQRKFFNFVKGHIDKLSADVTVFDKENVKDNDERCSFWTKTSEEIVPKFGKRF